MLRPIHLSLIFLISYTTFLSSAEEQLVHHTENSTPSRYLTLQKKPSSSSSRQPQQESATAPSSTAIPYNPFRTKNIYQPDKLHQISRSSYQAFLKCQACFYYKMYGMKELPSYPLSINSAFDRASKAQSDYLTEINEPFPVCHTYNEDPATIQKINARPFKHPAKSTWQNSLSGGLQYELPGTNLILQGGVDDVWQDFDTDELIVVDFKSTSTSKEPVIYPEYALQLTFYQYLLEKKQAIHGHTVSHTGYLLYSNLTWPSLHDPTTIQVQETLKPYTSAPEDFEKIEENAYKIYECLQSPTVPESSPTCALCARQKAVNEWDTRANKKRRNT